MVSTDRRINQAKKNIDYDSLEEKCRSRLYGLFIDKLLNIVVTFNRPVSKINEKVTLRPVTQEEILTELENRHGIIVKPEDIQVGAGIQEQQMEVDQDSLNEVDGAQSAMDETLEETIRKEGVEPEQASQSGAYIENVGDHYVNARYYSEQFDKEFTFSFIVRIYKEN